MNYLDILYPNGTSINTVTNIERNTVPAYKSEVTTFFRMIEMYAADNNYNMLETYKMAHDDKQIATANWTQIKRMLTCLSRAERISLNNNARAIESSRIQRILLRLKELAKN